MKNLSPLRYAGSKKNLAPYLHQIIKYNKIKPTILVEPFVGGGSVTLYFLKNNIVEKAIISDKDPLIFSFWKTVFTNSEYLIDFVKHVDVNLETFYEYKKIARNCKKYKNEKLAEACIFLNRTSFSGLLTDEAGPLGGKSQKSDYKLDCRFNINSLIKKIEIVASYSKRVTVLSYDWRETIDFVKEKLKAEKKSNSIIFYLDPPFYNKANKLYRAYFQIKDHKLLFDSVINLPDCWVLSYDNAPEIKKMYASKKSVLNIEMLYSINSKRREKELVITPLELPNI